MNLYSDLRCRTPLLSIKQGRFIFLLLPRPALETGPSGPGGPGGPCGPGWTATGGFVKEKTTKEEAAATQ